MLDALTYSTVVWQTPHYKTVTAFAKAARQQIFFFVPDDPVPQPLVEGMSS